jgi:hypothetical protein
MRVSDAAAAPSSGATGTCQRNARKDAGIWPPAALRAAADAFRAAKDQAFIIEGFLL